MNSDSSLPTDFNTIVLGTDVAESLLASAAARAGHSVLDIDDNTYYGGNWAAFNFEEFINWADHCNNENNDRCFCNISYEILEYDSQETMVKQENPSDSIETNCTKLKVNDLSRRFGFELVPKLVSCRGDFVELLLDSGIGRYMEFKLVDKICVRFRDGTVEKVPTSKEDIFTNKQLSLVDKRCLMKFFMAASKVDLTNESEIQELQRVSLSGYLDKFNIMGKHRSIFVNAIANRPENDPTKCSAFEGLQQMQKYFNSLGRFGNSPLLGILHAGGSEISQALCRVCAVYGGIFMLNQKISTISFKECKSKWTVQTSLGDIFTCQHLVLSMDYAYLVKSFLAEPSESVERTYISRAIVVTDKSLFSDSKLNVTILSPNRDDEKAVRVIQLCDELQVVPTGMFILYFSVPSSAGKMPQDDLEGAIGLLVQTPGTFEPSSPKPKALFMCYYTHSPRPLPRTDNGNLFIVPDPDETIDYDSIIVLAKELWRKLPFGDDFLPNLPDPEGSVVEVDAAEDDDADTPGVVSSE